MNKSSLDIFTEGVALFATEFFWEAIEKFELVVQYGSLEFADDATLNLAICYMRLGLHHEANIKFLQVYQKEIGNNSYEDAGGITGSPSERAALGLFRIALANSDFDGAERYLDELRKYHASGLIIDGSFIPFYEIAHKELSSSVNHQED